MLHLKKIVGSAKLSNRKIIAKRKKRKWQNSMQFTTPKKGNFFGWNRKPYRSKRGAEWSYQHADPERIHLNENIIVTEHCSRNFRSNFGSNFRGLQCEIMPEN